MKTRSFVSILVSIVLVLLLAGGAGAYWLVSRNPLLLMQGVEQANPNASIFLSRQSPLAVSLLVHPDRLGAFGLAITPPSQRKRVQAQWRHFRQTFFADSQIDYRRDIQPWLGNELTFAVTTTDIDRDALNGEQPGYLLAAAVRDSEQANQAIQAYWQRQATEGMDLVFEPFAGINLVYGNIAPPPSRVQSDSRFSSLTTAVVGDRFVLFANHPKVLRDAINNLQVPELSLSQSEAYQQALQRLTTPHIGLAFVHLPQLAVWFGEAEQNPKASLDSPTFDSLLMALQLDDQGIIANTQLLTAPDQTIEPTQPTLTQPVQALRYIPAISPLVAVGHDLQQDWTHVEAGLAGYHSLQTLLHKPLRSLAQQWSVDIEEIMGWMQDDYALGLLPRSDVAQPDWVFVAKQTPELSDRLTQLDQQSQEQGISTGRFTIANYPVTAWTKLSTRRSPGRINQREVMTVQAEVQGVHASVEEYEIFATSLDAIAQALEATQNSLLSTDRFQQEIAALPSPNNGYLFVDWMALRKAIGSSSPDLLDLKARFAFLKPVMDEVRTLTLSSEGSSTNAARGTIFLRL